MEHVILVNETDQEIGIAAKIEAHQKNLLHRAFSVLIFNSKNEILIQRRAKTKYHSGGLWSNSCCSHPIPGETINEAVKRRLEHELGVACESNFLFKFIYQVSFENGLSENELDYVFVGRSDCNPVINLDEIDAWKWVSMDWLNQDMQENPDTYTHWFHLIMEKLPEHRVEVYL